VSHTTLIKSVAIRDTHAIRQAVERLQSKGVKIELKENCKPRMYFAHQGEQCEYVLHMPDCRFDVGLKLQKDGTYAPMYDEHANAVGSVIGAACNLPTNKDDRSLWQLGRFLQGYAEFAAINAASAAGYMVESSEVDEKGNVQLMLASY
jgi:hypothetical protein